MKRIILLFFLHFFIASFFHFSFAQDAMKVLDIAADRIQKAGNVNRYDVVAGKQDEAGS